MEKQRTIKHATEHNRYALLGIFYSSDITSSKELENPQNQTWWQVKEQNLGNFKTLEDAHQKMMELESSSVNLLGYEIRDIPDFKSSHVEVYDAKKTMMSSYDEGGHLPGGRRHHEPCMFSQGDKALAVLHAPYDAVVPCVVVGHITEEAERENWELNDTKDYYSSYEEFVEKWDDWQWDTMVVRPLVKLKSITWGDTMPETITVPRVFLFPSDAANKG